MPYLICNPVPIDEVDYFLVEIDGQAVRSDAEINTLDSTCRLHHDVTGVSLGSHTARVAAVNMWGDGEFSDPFDFIKTLPGPVSGVGLEV